MLPQDTDQPEEETWLPEILPGGTVLYSARITTRWNVMAAFPDGTRKILIEGGFEARWLPQGYLLYLDNEAEVLMAVPFDPKRVEITGGAIPIAREVDGWYCFDLGPEGTLAYVPNVGGDEQTVAITDRTGALTPMLETPGPFDR